MLRVDVNAHAKRITNTVIARAGNAAREQATAAIVLVKPSPIIPVASSVTG